jgi:microcystin-dependent protein
MSEPFVGEIRMFGFGFAPQGWAPCNAQLVPISQNQALFSLLGTTYGGDGVTTFALPDLRSRVPAGQGQGPGLSPYAEGQAGGAETVTLAAAQMPGHPPGHGQQQPRRLRPARGPRPGPLRQPHLHRHARCQHRHERSHGRIAAW